ncbi:MAG: hypothetical protein ACYCOU_16875 [Sulfobacillus sp.]
MPMPSPRAVRAFNNHLVKLLDLIKKRSRSQSNLVKRCFRSFKADHAQFCRQTIELFSPHRIGVSQQDANLFSKDYASSLVLLPELDLQRVYRECRFTDDDLRQLWMELQRLYILSHKVLDLPLDEWTQELLETLQSDARLPELIAELGEFEDEKGVFDQIGNLVSGDNLLLRLAKDISTELANSGHKFDSAAVLSELSQMIAEKRRPEGGQIADIVEFIAGIIQKKIDAGEFTRESLHEEAKKLKEELLAGISKLPLGKQSKLLKKILNGGLVDESAVQEMAKQFRPAPGQRQKRKN